MSEHSTDHRFNTPGPTSLYVESGSGSVRVTATETEVSTVGISGRDAEEVTVTEEDGQLSVVAPKRRAGFFAGDSSLAIRVTLPTGSQLVVRTGSADITVDGTVGTSQVRTGSGEVRMGQVSGPAQVETGSGDITLDAAEEELQIKSGSGDVRVTRTLSAVAVSTGSGDVDLGSTAGPAVVKTGSGDFRIVAADGDVSLSTGSGDLLVETARRGRFTLKAASGDVRIGIPAGIPVWTDISSLSGRVHSDLVGVGEPTEGAEHIEVRAKTVSGDVVLTQL